MPHTPDTSPDNDNAHLYVVPIIGTLNVDSDRFEPATTVQLVPLAALVQKLFPNDPREA